MENTRREFIKKSLLLSGAAGLSTMLPPSIQRALAIDPRPGSTYQDAEHVVILMQENRSFDHCFGTLKGVRGFNDPRAISLPNGNPVWLQSNDQGLTYAPFRLDIKESRITWMRDLPHSRHDQVDAGNWGKHDRWLEAKKPHRDKTYENLPLTMGYYTRQDIPFNYAFADAFTVCDHNFCSINTSTFPNRLYLMSGTVREKPGSENQAHIRNPDVTRGGLQWETFPEVLEKNDISWRVYQNDLSTGGGYKGDEKSWLANYDCNVLEYFDRYHVKFNTRYGRNIRKQIEELPGEIEALQSKLKELGTDSDEYTKTKRAIQTKQEVLDKARAEAKKFAAENFEKLPQEEQNLYNQAFTINKNDPGYDRLTTLSYDDGTKRTVEVPEGDVLHQFRSDVNNGKLPTVSWLVPPAKFSDHPSSPWYGAWYVSEILEILTKNPEIWKKTIFILTYDENDGYFDHVPPFTPPSSLNPKSGKTSNGIDIDTEFVRFEDELKAGVNPKVAREAPIGLGFRVPMIIASPWSRGGKVCSQVFDHTSSLQFLEGFLSKKTGKDIKCHNISTWRRTVCGDLTAAFRPYNPNVKDAEISFLSRDSQIESIHKAQFKDIPSGFKELTDAETERARQGDLSLAFMPKQEQGIRKACALPYQLQVAGKLSADKKAFEINLAAGNDVFGAKSAGAPFKIYAPDKYQDETSKNGFETARSWDYAVIPGDTVSDKWAIDSFENRDYHLRVYGPNGFYREFKGSSTDPEVTLKIEEERHTQFGKLTGNLVLHIENLHKGDYTVLINDNAYKTADIQRKIASKGSQQSTITISLNLEKSFGWYDFSIRIAGFEAFEQRFAGHIETGEDTFTDPFMGRTV